VEKTVAWRKRIAEAYLRDKQDWEAFFKILVAEIGKSVLKTLSPYGRKWFGLKGVRYNKIRPYAAYCEEKIRVDE